MLGVRRSTVTVIAGSLQRAGLIHYRRGTITVLDRRRLEATACECYGIVRDTYERSLLRAVGSTQVTIREQAGSASAASTFWR